MTKAPTGPEQASPALESPNWSRRLLVFLRVVAGLMMLKGLYHWSTVLGVGVSAANTFENRSLAWQTATVFFAVIDLFAAVGLWMTAAWGGVIWLTGVMSMIAVEVFFPQIYGGSLIVVVTEFALIAGYVALTLLAARERPP